MNLLGMNMANDMGAATDASVPYRWFIIRRWHGGQASTRDAEPRQGMPNPDQGMPATLGVHGTLRIRRCNPVFMTSRANVWCRWLYPGCLAGLSPLSLNVSALATCDEAAFQGCRCQCGDDCANTCRFLEECTSASMRTANASYPAWRGRPG